MSVPSDSAFRFAQYLDPRLIADCIKDEQISVQALVVSHVPKPMRPRILKELPSPSEVIAYLAKTTSFDTGVVTLVARTVRGRCKTRGSDGTVSFLGLQQAAHILKEMPDRSLLQSLKDEEPELFAALAGPQIDRKKILYLNYKHLQKLLQSIDDSTLNAVLSEATEEERCFILSGISARRRENLKDVQDTSGQTEEGFTVLIRQAKEMNKRGELIWGGEGEWVE